MNRYERYKDSGIPWLGEVPAHWDTMSLKYICDVRDGTHDTPKYVYESDNSYPLVTSKDISNGNINFESAKFISEEDYLDISKRSNVNFGDLLMPMIGTVGGSVLVETYRKFTIKNVALFKAGQFCAKWLKYFLDSELSKIQFELEKNGGVQDFVGLTTLRNLIILKLPLKEQTAIAHYLDTKLSEIDALIDKQQTLLEKLAEQRTAVITQAVTKGLNPAAPMKNSGVEWLGDVPAHWDIVGISKLFMLKAGGDLQPDFFSREKDNEHCYPIYTNANDEHAVYGYTSKKRFNADSITVSGRGDIGFAVYRDHDFDAIIRLLVLSPLKKLDCKYYTYSINALLDFKFESSAVAQLSTVQLAQYKLLLPSYEEQAAIADYLDQETTKIDRLCETVNQTIGCLKEYRTALITQAVTGKIKVTNE
jgi:type I restriction-modification